MPVDQLTTLCSRFGVALVALTALGLSACAESPTPPVTSLTEPPFDLIDVTATMITDERMVDGRIEGLQQGG